jgi:hypothetical protein
MVREALITDTPVCGRHELLQRHERVLAAMQHERIVHLLVTLAFGLFLLMTMIGAFLKPHVLLLLLGGMFLLLLFPYIFHYYFLENCVQRWYRLTEQIGKMDDEAR